MGPIQTVIMSDMAKGVIMDYVDTDYDMGGVTDALFNDIFNAF